MANYNYTHGATTDANRLRLIIGDHRGTNGTSATGWLFSDEELADILIICPNKLQNAAALCLQIRLNREALNAGVSGTTDTTDRPAAIANAMRGLERLDLRGISEGVTIEYEARTNEDLADDEELAL